MNFSYKNIALMFFLLLLAFGCAGVPVKKTSPSPASGPGIYHKVSRGETLWRIAKTYNVPLEEVIRMNGIMNVTRITANQLLFIPGVTEVKPIALDPGGAEKTNEFLWPISSTEVIFYFGDRTSGFGISNKGIDIKATAGEAVSAARSGKVIFADYLPGYAFTIILDHADGFSTVYSNNSEILVNLGDSVTRGQAIGRVGKLGKLAFLHFEIRKNKTASNPIYYLSYERNRPGK